MNETIASKLIGTWSLVSRTETGVQSGNVVNSLSKSPTGLITYTRGGFMAALLAPDKNGEPKIAYTGNYEVNEPERYVLHKVVVGLSPNTGGSVLKRNIELRDNFLILRTDPLVKLGLDEKVVHQITWQRVTDQ